VRKEEKVDGFAVSEEKQLDSKTLLTDYGIPLDRCLNESRQSFMTN